MTLLLMLVRFFADSHSSPTSTASLHQASQTSVPAPTVYFAASPTSGKRTTNVTTRKTNFAHFSHSSHLRRSLSGLRALSSRFILSRESGAPTSNHSGYYSSGFLPTRMTLECDSGTATGVRHSNVGNSVGVRCAWSAPMRRARRPPGATRRAASGKVRS
jgi:hypothetical protein